MSHEKNCILAGPCKKAGGPSCSTMCPFFLALHGRSGTGGRSGASGIPAQYKLLTLSSSPARGSQEAAYKRLDKYVETFARQFEKIERPEEQIKSLYLYSEAPGTGKTTSAAAVMNEYLIRHYIGSLKLNRQPLQRPVFFLDVNEWQTQYNEFNRNGVPRSVSEPAAAKFYAAREAAKSCSLAVLDDLGVRSASEGFRGDVHSVINHRVSNNLPTIYTSNIPMIELMDVFDSRLYDRTRDLTVEIEFLGESKRGMRKGAAR